MSANAQKSDEIYEFVTFFRAAKALASIFLRCVKFAAGGHSRLSRMRLSAFWG